MALSERARIYLQRKKDRRENLQVQDRGVTITRRQFLVGSAALILAGIGIGDIVSEDEKVKIAPESTSNLPLNGDTTQPEQPPIYLFVEENFPIQEIVDRKGYEESALHLKDILLRSFTPQFLADNPEILAPFEGMSNLSNAELQNRLILRSEAENSQTGFQNGIFNSARFVVRTDAGDALVGGVIDERRQDMRVSLQIDKDLNVMAGEVDPTPRFSKGELRYLIDYVFGLPMQESGVDIRDIEGGLDINKIVNTTQDTKKVQGFAALTSGYMMTYSFNDRLYQRRTDKVF